MSDKDYNEAVLAYIRPCDDERFAAEVVVKDDYRPAKIVQISDRALLNMLREATKILAERKFFEGKEKDNGLD
jgi:hypothetical protein